MEARGVFLSSKYNHYIKFLPPFLTPYPLQTL
nr:MAG TPA: hypothetical protein [Caudoviricetes sp.]